MELFSAVLDIKKQYPSLDDDEIRSAMDSEANYEEGRLVGQRKYARAVETAHYRILVWLKDGNEYKFDPTDPNQVAKFVINHRLACAWATLKCKAGL